MAATITPSDVGSSPRFRAIREARGLSLREVARRSGIDKSHLSRVERGQATLTTASLARLATALELRDLAAALAAVTVHRERS